MAWVIARLTEHMIEGGTYLDMLNRLEIPKTYFYEFHVGGRALHDQLTDFGRKR